MKLIDSVPERHSEREAVRLAEEKRLKEERERLQEEAERRRNGSLTNQLSVLSLICFKIICCIFNTCNLSIQSRTAQFHIIKNGIKIIILTLIQVRAISITCIHQHQ